MLRGDFHHHIDADPMDGWFVSHSAGQLIDHAVQCGLNVLSITCHEGIPYDGDATRYAAERGVVLLRGMEATVEGHHLLLLNFRDFPPGICTWADVAARKTPDALVIAPHPFYPVGQCAGDRLEEHRALVDAVEFSGLYTPLTQRFNRRAAEYARRSHLPVVGDSDTHFLWQLGRTYTLIDAPLERDAILAAIRGGRVQLVTQPLSWKHIVRFVVESKAILQTFNESLDYMLRILRRTRSAHLRNSEKT